jgi:hypothetical protein
VFAVSSQGQTLPPDINLVTLSRLPPVTPGDLDAEGQRLLAARQNVNPAPGPGHITIYNPKAAEGQAPAAAAPGAAAAAQARTVGSQGKAWPGARAQRCRSSGAQTRHFRSAEKT